MRAALARADIPAVVALFRAATGLSQDEFGQLIDESQSTVSLIERGRRDTLSTIHRFLAFVDTIGMPRTALVPLILGDPQVTLDATLGEDSVLDLPTGDSDVKRREFHGLAAGLFAAGLLPPGAVPDRVSSAHVRYLQAAVPRIQAHDQMVGGGAVLQQAIRMWSRARHMVDSADYTDHVGRELLTVAADLAIECGWLAFDAGLHDLSRKAYAEAHLMAAAAEDAERQAHAWVNLSMQATYLSSLDRQRSKGLAREGLRLAGLAAGAARYEPSPRLHALIALRQAMAYAALGDAGAFKTSITQSRRELDRRTRRADAAWSAFVTEAEITGHEAHGLRQLGQRDVAINLYAGAANDRSLSPRNRACYSASLVGTLLEVGDRSEAVSRGRQVLPQLSCMTSVRPIRQLQPVRLAAEQAGDEEFCAVYDSARAGLAGLND